MTKILVVGDEFLLAMAFADELLDNNFAIAGPYIIARDASCALDEDKPDIALLDVNLGKGRTSFALADELCRRGTSVVFLTGYGKAKTQMHRYLRGSRLHHNSFLEPVAILERELGAR